MSLTPSTLGADSQKHFTAENAEERRGFIGYCAYSAVTKIDFLCVPLRPLRLKLLNFLTVGMVQVLKSVFLTLIPLKIRCQSQ